GVEAGTQANEGDGLNFDDVYQKFGRRAKGASGQVYDIREVGAQPAEPVTLVCKIIDCTLDCHGFPTASLEAKEEALARATRELHTMQDLDHHPHIVHLHQWFQEGYTMFLVMHLATEGTLATYPFKIWFDQALVLITQIMDAVANGYTHRDLKPANILLSREGEDLKAIVADFGISEQGKTHTSRSGTQGFRAPEVLTESTHNNKVDSWAIGLILWDMLFGTTYFVEDPSAEANTINWGVVKTKRAMEVEAAKTKAAKAASNKAWSQVEELLRGLLLLTPNARWTVGAARQHPLVRNIASSVAKGLPSPGATVLTLTEPPSAAAGPSTISERVCLGNELKSRKVSDVPDSSDLSLAGASTSSKRKREVSPSMTPPQEVTTVDDSAPDANRSKGKGRRR
ncbi:Calcium/calmodulin-dependent protein kinase type 1, partial [Tulasnella sp. JGI-2019a]